MHFSWNCLGFAFNYPSQILCTVYIYTYCMYVCLYHYISAREIIGDTIISHISSEILSKDLIYGTYNFSYGNFAYISYTHTYTPNMSPRKGCLVIWSLWHSFFMLLLLSFPSAPFPPLGLFPFRHIRGRWSITAKNSLPNYSVMPSVKYTVLNTHIQFAFYIYICCTVYHRTL